MQAAQRAGTTLDKLVQFPEKAKDIIKMFPSALLTEQVNENKNFI